MTASMEDGHECLAFHRGKWLHVKYSAEHKRFHLYYGGPFISLSRETAPLPPKPEGADGFYDWKN